MSTARIWHLGPRKIKPPSEQCDSPQRLGFPKEMEEESAIDTELLVIGLLTRSTSRAAAQSSVHGDVARHRGRHGPRRPLALWRGGGLRRAPRRDSMGLELKYLVHSAADPSRLAALLAG